MITSIIAIGNSRGIRIPRPVLLESGLSNEVKLQVKKGEIKITPAPAKITSSKSTLLLSEKALSDWNNPQEDEAWKSLQ